MRLPRPLFCLCTSLLLTVIPLVPAQAEGWPARPVRIIASAAPGGGVDIIARILARALSEQFGGNFIVEDQGGAGGTIAANAVAKASPDGYTLLVCANAELTLAPYVHDHLPYDPIRDLTAVALVASSPTVVAVNPQVPARNMQELIAYARSKGGVGYGTPGYGSIAHVNFDFIRAEAGLSFFHVPYKGGGPAVTDLLGGQLQMAVVTLPPIGAAIESGLARPIAVLQPDRSPMLPNVLTLKEAANLAVGDASSWFALLAPSGTPPEIVAKLEAAVQAGMTPAVRERLGKAFLNVAVLTGDAFAARLREESAANAKAIARIGFKPQ